MSKNRLEGAWDDAERAEPRSVNRNPPIPPDTARTGLGTVGSQGSKRSAVAPFTHVNVTLGNLHGSQASILEKVPACHLRGEQVEGDLTTGFGTQTAEGKRAPRWMGVEVLAATGRVTAQEEQNGGSICFIFTPISF